MDITYLGHASFRIKGKSISLITDPYDSQMVGFKFPKISADIVTVSHAHSDHNNLSAVQDVRKVIDGPGEYEIGGVSIIGYPAFHDDKKGAERGKNNIYVYEVDEIRICHLGDLGHPLSSDLIEELGTIDVLMIPVGGYFTISAEEAAKVARDIEAPIVVPMHYATDGLKDEIKNKLTGLDEFLTLSGLTVDKMDKLTLKKSDIASEGQKIIVLDRKN